MTTTKPLIRLVAIVALVVGTLVLAFAGSGPVSAQDGPVVDPVGITTSYTSVPNDAPCTTFPDGVVHNVGNTETEFIISIRVTRSLCTQVLATPVIYAMPSDTVAWPQTFVERGRITIQKSGVYEIRFTKTCDPQQFDLIAGDSPSATPPTIAPTGPWHGPMLFPFDLATALQWPGCRTPRTSTTTTTTSTTTSTTTTSTTVPSTTAPSTTAPSTTAPTTTAPTTTVPADVAGETTIVTPTTAQVLGVQQTNANLAFTGIGTKPALFGAVLIAFGLFFMLLGRKPISER